MATSQTAFGLCQVCDRLHSERIGAIVDHSTEEVRCPDASQSTFKPIVPGPHCSVPTLPTASAPACAHGRLAAQLGSAADERRAILRCSCHVLRHAVTCCRMLPHVAGCRHMLRVLLHFGSWKCHRRGHEMRRRSGGFSNESVSTGWHRMYSHARCARACACHTILRKPSTAPCHT